MESGGVRHLVQFKNFPWKKDTAETRKDTFWITRPKGGITSFFVSLKKMLFIADRCQTLPPPLSFLFYVLPNVRIAVLCVSTLCSCCCATAPRRTLPPSTFISIISICSFLNILSYIYVSCTFRAGRFWMQELGQLFRSGAPLCIALSVCLYVCLSVCL